MIEKNELAEIYTLSEPLSREDSDTLEKNLGFRLPEDYREFLKISNGLEIDSGVALLEIEEIGQRNIDYEVQEYLPGYVMIGDDGGGQALLMKNGESTIYEVGMGTMDLETMERSASSLEEFLIGFRGKPLAER